jgi:peptidoglycan hydrolase-like protein with peptidoglycan-binding domain
LSVCSSSNVCASISVVVNQITQTTSSVSATIGDGYVFSVHLEYGMTSKAVTELQKRLTAKGVYTGPITGYYGSLTTTAVKLFQKKNNLEQLGSVGPGTRAALNK